MSTASRLSSFDGHPLGAGRAPMRRGLTADHEEQEGTRPARLPALNDSTEGGHAAASPTVSTRDASVTSEKVASHSPATASPSQASDGSGETMVAPSAAVDSTEIEISEAAAPASALSDVPTTADPNASNQETLAALAASIHRIGQDMERFRETAERRAAEGFGAAAAQCVPSLATEGFTREVTAAVLNIARELRTETATLLLPPDDVQAVAGALNERNPEIAFTLAGDPSLAPGTARITWPKGGAALSADRLAEAAMDIFHRHLSSPAPALQPTAETVPTTEPQPH